MANLEAKSIKTARFAMRMLLACALFGSPVSVGFAQETLPQGSVADATSALDAALGRRGDLTLRKSTLEAALMTIGELWKVNIVAGELDGQVNGVFKDAPLREILDSVLLGNGYGYRMVGESIVITPIAELGSVNPYFEQTAIQLRNVKPSEIATAVEVLSTPHGQIRPLDSAGALIVVDFPDRIKKIRELASKIDAASVGQLGSLDANGLPRPLKVMYRHLQFISASKASTALDAVLSSAGRVSVIEGEDRIVIADYEANLEMAQSVLDQIDAPRPQVKIKALIYDISLKDLEALGLNWNSASKGRIDSAGDPQTSLSVDSVTQLPFTSSTTGGTVTFSNLSEHFDLTAVLLAVQTASDARLLADPSVFVMDNEEATFESVSEIPYQQLTQTSAGGSIGTTAFRDAGIKLRVKPKISADGTIELDVTPEFSRLTGFTPGDNQPIIDRRTAQTKLRVGNGQTVMIGGLRQRTDVGEFSGLPGLKDMRYIGPLFRSRQTDIRESELVVFISPEISGYSPPQSCREQRIADTVRARLDHIPQAEGAPPCSFGGPEMQPMISPEVIHTPMPESMAPGAHGYSEPGFTPSDAALDQAKMHFPLGIPRNAAPPRRLPPVTDTRIVNMPADAFVPPPMRPSYDERFRATGGVYGQQRQNGPPTGPTAQPPAESTAEKQPFWRRMMR